VRRATENIFPWCAQGRTWASLDNSETRSYNLCSGGPREIYRCQREIGCKFNWPSHSSRDLWRGLSGVCRQMCTKMLFDRSHSLSLFGIEAIVRNILCQLQLYTCVAIMKCYSSQVTLSNHYRQNSFYDVCFVSSSHRKCWRVYWCTWKT